MAQLVRGMYESPRGGEPSTLFGLSNGQIRQFVRGGKNAGWYNAAGERLGCGDINIDALERISAELDDGEVFVTLGEHESQSIRRGETSNPPAYYAQYLITHGQVWWVDSRRFPCGNAEILVYAAGNERDVVVARVVKPDQVKDLLADPVKFAAEWSATPAT